MTLAVRQLAGLWPGRCSHVNMGRTLDGRHATNISRTRIIFGKEARLRLLLVVNDIDV